MSVTINNALSYKSSILVFIEFISSSKLSIAELALFAAEEALLAIVATRSILSLKTEIFVLISPIAELITSVRLFIVFWWEVLICSISLL